MVAITGATGFVGQRVLDLCMLHGIDVRALTRKPRASCSRISWFTGDLQSKDVLKKLVTMSGEVFHIAGAVNARTRQGFHEANVAGTKNVIEAMQSTVGADRLVFVSSLAAREPSLSHYGASKYEAEQLVKQSGLDWTIVRPPAVFGPGDTEMLELFRATKFGVLPMPPKGRASVIHVDDLAELLLLMDPDDQYAEKLRGAIFEPDDGRPNGWAHSELATAIGEAMGGKVWAPAMPKALLMGAAKLDRLFRGPKAKLTPDRASYMSHPDWVSSPDKTVPAEIWQPQIETRQGLAATAAWYRAQGWL